MITITTTSSVVFLFRATEPFHSFIQMNNTNETWPDFEFRQDIRKKLDLTFGYPLSFNEIVRTRSSNLNDTKPEWVVYKENERQLTANHREFV